MLAILACWVVFVAGCLPTRDNPATCKTSDECPLSSCDTMTFRCIPVMSTGGTGGGRGGGAAAGGATVSGGGGTAGVFGASGGSVATDGGAGRATGGAGDAAIEMQVGCPVCTGATPVCDMRACRGCRNNTECQSPTAPVCSMATGECVECLAPTDCKVAIKPICNATHVCEACTQATCMASYPTLPACLGTGACVQCTTTILSQCSGATPVCDPSNRCAGCMADLQCSTKSSMTPACITGTGAGGGSCVACTTPAHCTTAIAPICNTMTHSCAGCMNDGECRTRNGAMAPACVPAASTGAGSCVACLNDTHCPMPTTPICNVTVTARTCRACTADVDCRAKNTNLPACITGTGTGSGSCVACTNDSHCMTAATPICDTVAHTCKACGSDTECRTKNTSLPACITGGGTGSGSCVPCTNDSHCMTAIAPICNTGSHMCAACTSDAQCVAKLGSPDPGVCMFHTDGHCATPGEVLYVRAASGCNDLGMGLVSMPFCTPQAAIGALTPARPTIVIRVGTLPTERWSSAGGVPRLSVVGQGNPVIGPSVGTGITVTAGDVYIRGLSVTGMGEVGILATTGATIRLDRCVVTDNFGGLAVNGAAFAINNCVFARNANNAVTALPASFGGVFLRAPATGPQQFRNNTIVDNQGAGLTCNGAYQTRGLLVANNMGGTVTTCITDGTSFISTTAAVFNLTSPFHLTSASPCVNREVGTTDFPADDLDGNARPSGAAADCGAHELQQ